MVIEASQCRARLGWEQRRDRRIINEQRAAKCSRTQSEAGRAGEGKARQGKTNAAAAAEERSKQDSRSRSYDEDVAAAAVTPPMKSTKLLALSNLARRS